MARSVRHMVAVKHAMQRRLEDDAGVVEVVSVLSPRGPEVHVVVRRGHEKRLRLKLPTERIGIPVVVRVA